MPGCKSARPTKADVARLANVSPATVSYVLNDVEGQTISAQTRAAVHAAAKELGYRPNLAARNLAVGGSGVVLYIVPRISLGELLIEVGSRLTTALARHGVVLSLQFETDDGRNVVDAVADLNPIAVTSVFPLERRGTGGGHRRGHPADPPGQRAAARDGCAAPDDRRDAGRPPGRARAPHGWRSPSPTSSCCARSATTGWRACGSRRPGAGCPTSSSGRSRPTAPMPPTWCAAGSPTASPRCARRATRPRWWCCTASGEAGLRCPEDLAVMGVDASRARRGQRPAADLGRLRREDHRRRVGGGDDGRTRAIRRAASRAATTSRI